MTKAPEIRTFRGTLELRAAAPESASVGVLTGYAAKFNRPSRNLGGFVEQLSPGAFSKTIADGSRVMARYNHEDSALLGTTDAGTLRLFVDEVGLRYEVDLPDTEMGRTCKVLAERGDLHFSSFAFIVMPDGDSWGYTDSDFPLRTLTNVQLIDVAPVNDPAYLDTSSGLRSLAEARGLDPQAVTDAAARDELRVLLTSSLDEPKADEAAPPVAADDAPTSQTPSDDAPRRSLDDARRRLALMRAPR